MVRRIITTVNDLVVIDGYLKYKGSEDNMGIPASIPKSINNLLQIHYVGPRSVWSGLDYVLLRLVRPHR